jgi:hypothetical protein
MEAYGKSHTLCRGLELDFIEDIPFRWLERLPTKSEML